MNWFQKMFQSNFLRKQGQGIPIFLFLFLFFPEPLWSHNSAWGSKRNSILTLTTTFHFTIFSPTVMSLQWNRQENWNKRRKGRWRERKKNQSNRTSGTRHGLQQIKVYRFQRTRVNKYNFYSSCSCRIMIPIYCYTCPHCRLSQAHVFLHINN